MMARTAKDEAQEAISRQSNTAEASPLVETADIEELARRAVAGEGAATEALLQQFQPLLRSRAHGLWSTLQESLLALEWSDVEAQVQLFFLVRLHAFRPDEGTYFAFYMERMLDLDCRAWLRSQNRGMATPFSQMVSEEEDFEEDPFYGVALGEADCSGASAETAGVDQKLLLRESLAKLSEPHRAVIWECCLRDRTEEDVASELGVSRSTVRNRLADALGRLRELMESDAEASLAPANADTSTRTGRARSAKSATADAPVSRQREQFWDFWLEKMTMAKNERRPDLVGVGAGKPILLQGTFDFPATGLRTPRLLSPKLRHEVAPGSVVGVRYVRVGVICPEMSVISTVVNGLPHRLIPVAANSTQFVPLAIVDALCAGSQIEIHIASDSPGTAIIDVGCLQMPA